MYTGTEIKTPQDAESYAEELCRNAQKEARRRLDAAESAIDAWYETRTRGNRARAANAWRLYLSAKSNEHYMKGYLQGIRDMVSALT